MLKAGRVWKYSLGSFSDERTKQYDNTVCVIRTVILLFYIITNCFIVAGVVRHWDNTKHDTNNILYKSCDVDS